MTPTPHATVFYLQSHNIPKRVSINTYPRLVRPIPSRLNSTPIIFRIAFRHPCQPPTVSMLSSAARTTKNSFRTGLLPVRLRIFIKCSPFPRPLWHPPLCSLPKYKTGPQPVVPMQPHNFPKAALAHIQLPIYRYLKQEASASAEATQSKRISGPQDLPTPPPLPANTVSTPALNAPVPSTAMAIFTFTKSY